MGTTSTLNSVLSALGGSTGIDVTSAVNAILYADRAPERGWQAQQTTLANETTALNQLQTQSSTLSNDLAALQDPTGVLSSAVATSTNSSLLTASVVPGTPSSGHLITINNLAVTGSWYSDAQTSSSSPLTDGSFQITVGTGSPTTITVGSGSDTLDELAASINSQSLGVTANVVTDSSGARLSLVADNSGAAADFTVTNDSSVAFTRANTGTDASIKVDGVPITSATNTVTGALSGVTLNLQGAAAGTEIGLQVGADTASISSAINNFVSDYNTLIANVNSQFTYNPTTNVAGTLQQDSAVQGLQSQLLEAGNYLASSGAYTTLTSLGITTNSDGTLSVNSATLDNAIETNSTAVASFFQGTAQNGFAGALSNTLNTYTDPTEGAFTVDLQSISSEDQDLTNQTNTLELYLTSQQTILTAKYNAADIAIQQLPQQIKQVQALLNPNSDSSSS